MSNSSTFPKGLSGTTEDLQQARNGLEKDLTKKESKGPERINSEQQTGQRNGPGKWSITMLNV